MLEGDGPIVVKLGGEVIGSAALGVVARDLAEIARSGGRVVIVHGGGPQATKLSERLGIATRQVAGRRVTDEQTLDVMKMVVAGKLNVDLCAALGAAGAKAVGLHGASARVIEAERRPPTVYASAGPDPVDLGLVGDVTAVNKDLLGLLTGAGYIPVLACLGAGRDGTMYNINADTVANRVAIELVASGLMLISDVPGVLRDVADPTSRIARLTIAEGHRLIAEGAVTKGMIPKLEESFAALTEGVRRIHIVGRLAPGDLVREAASPGTIGTVLVAS
ncbi:Acetylglutamate kinase [Minicystis rosea]|nr:Acetylglutamate kinase [Minicystis rosea]